MNAREAAARVTRELVSAGIEDAAFEAEYLVRTAAGISRAQFFARAELNDSDCARLDEIVSRRLTREPAAYIAGEREFYGLALEVSPDVLLPRPETELLVDLAIKETASLAAPVIIDVGTGSGAIAIATSLKLPGATVIGTDVSELALAVAARNTARHGAKVQFVVADLLTPFRRADIILANLPYIPTEEVQALEPEVRDWEPIVALDGGGDGLELVRAIVDDCAGRLRPGLLALEIGFGQSRAVQAYCESRGAKTEIVPDLAGIERVVCARWE
ncbi:MAG: peptide chain release factor N(5)-glutamine methyltransferase [Anaerolinea sp.]|nr:peptide chain release factor N(5)-glutamine methyltransferase [Anaerolinea sp.]